MLKNILKTSMCAFVLLGTLSSLDSSYGMDEENKKKWSFFKKKNTIPIQPKEQKSSRLDWILMPLGNPRKHTFGKTSGDLKVAEKESPFSMLPTSVKEYLFSFFDPQSTLKIELVCKNWGQLIHNRQNTLKEICDKKKEFPNFLNFLFDPRNILWIQSELAPLFPYQPLNLKSDEDSEILMENFSDNRLQLLHHLTRAIKNFPGCHDFWVRTFMNLSPYEDFQKMGLASRIIKEVPALQDILREIIQKTVFEIDEFADICNKSSKHPALHMQALKLLSLSGDENAQKRMEEFIRMYAQKNIDSFALIDKKKNGNKICHFWTSFTDDQELLSRTLNTLKRFWNSPHEEDLKRKLHMDMGQLEAMGNYMFSIHSELKEEYEILFYQYLQRIYDLNGQKAPLLPILDEKTLQNFKTPGDFLDQTYRFVLREQYEEADKTLNVALDKFSKSPSYFYILQVKVENFLRSGNKDKFNEAEKCIEILIKAFEGKDILESPLTEGSMEKIHRSDIYVLQGALYLFSQEFEKAYQSLQLGLTEDRIREMFGFLLPPLQAHLSIIPKKIIHLLRTNQSICDIISFPLPHNNSYKYGDVYQKLYKNPFKKLGLIIKNKKISKTISEETKKQNHKKDDEKK
jgi:hypothetical protein